MHHPTPELDLQAPPGRTVLLFSGGFLWNFLSALLGALLASMQRDFGLGFSAGGGLFSLWSLGFMAGAAAGALVGDRLGAGRLLPSTIALPLGCLALTTVQSTAVLALVLVSSGVAGGLLVTFVNASAAQLWPSRRAASLNVLNVFFNAGSIAGPAFAAAMLAAGQSWRQLYGWTALIAVLLPILALRHKLPTANATPSAAGLKTWASRRDVLLGMAAIALAGALEWGAAVWLVSFLALRWNLPATAASLTLTAFWAAMLAGRLTMAWLLQRLKVSELLTPLAVLVLASAVLFVATPWLPVSRFGAVLLGLSLAGLVPSILGLLMDRLSSQANALSGTAMVTVGLAGSLSPLLLGLLADRFSLTSAMYAIPALAALLLVLTLPLGRPMNSSLAATATT